MSMTMNARFYRDLKSDKTYQKQKAVVLACYEADVPIPEKTTDYFGFGHPPDLSEVKEDFIEIRAIDEFCTTLKDKYRNGFEIDVNKLPADCKIIKFFNTY